MAEVKKINGYDIIDHRITGIDTSVTSGSTNLITSGAVSVAIASEAEARIGADDTLNNELVDLQDNLAVESTTRANADTALSGSIDTLSERVTSLESLGRYLALWDCRTGLPTTNPSTLPYTYRSGDYYRVTSVSYKHTISITAINSYGYDANINAVVIANSSESVAGNSLLPVVNLLKNNGYTARQYASYARGTAYQAYTTSSCSPISGIYYDSARDNILSFTWSDTNTGYIYTDSGFSSITVTDTITKSNLYKHHITIAGTAECVFYSEQPSYTISTFSQWLYDNNYRDNNPLMGLPAFGTFVITSGNSYNCERIIGFDGGGLISLGGQARSRAYYSSAWPAFTDVVTAPNLRPSGSTYTGIASTVAETEEVKPGDVYFYDGTSWSLQINHISGIITDVKVNSSSVVTADVANIHLKTIESKSLIGSGDVELNISDLTDDTTTNPIDKADTLTGLEASITELNYTKNVTSNIQTQLDTLDDAKQDDLTDLSTFANNKYLHSNSSTGVLEWADADALPSQEGQSGKYLTTDGSTPSWATIVIPEVNDMTGATSTTAGTHGLVPAPAAGDQTKFLRGDATWVTLTDLPIVSVSTGQIAIGDTSVTVAYTGTFANAYAVDASNNQVWLDTQINSSNVVFELKEAYTEIITCKVVASSISVADANSTRY